MEHELFGNLTHLMFFRENNESYQILLKAARRIVKDRHPSPTSPILAEDLWARDRVFSLQNQQVVKVISEKALELRDLQISLSLAPISEAGEILIIQLIRAFLSYAVTQGDMKRTPLAGSLREVIGFTFVEKI